MEARFEQMDVTGEWQVVTPTSKCYRILGKEGVTSFDRLEEP